MKIKIFMTNSTQMDYGTHLKKLEGFMEQKLKFAETYVQGYLTIAGVKDPEVRAQQTTSPLSISFEKGEIEKNRTGSATYRIPGPITVEINRAARGEVPEDQEIVDEINLAYEAFKKGKDYIPNNNKIASKLREHFDRRNGGIPNPEQGIDALIESD